MFDDEAGSIDHDHDHEEVNSSHDKNVVEVPSQQKTVCTEVDDHGMVDNALVLGASSASSTDKELIMNNPQLHRLLNKMLDERILDVQSKGETSKSELISRLTPQTRHDNVVSTSKQTASQRKTQGMALIKSPSDTTIYAPALKKGMGTETILDLEVVNDNSQAKAKQKQSKVNTGHMARNEWVVAKTTDVPQTNGSLMDHRSANIVKPDLMLKILNFVDQLRLNFDGNEREDGRPEPEPEQIPRQPRSSISAPGLEDAQRHMVQALIEMEKFKAAVENLPGRILNTDLGLVLNNEVTTNNPANCVDSINAGFTLAPPPPEPFMVNNDINPQAPHLVSRQIVGAQGGVTDDDFFHLTCYIDPAVQRKVENGEYVDLDKLLPKDNNPLSKVTGCSETKLEWVQSEGSTYLVPAKTSSRINCFHRWEQAFRVYAMLYCTKNPSRAREIWQYVSVINTAVMSYNWDNVYSYDMVFRQLMEFNPSRSWAGTYNQMWNLSMTNPITNNQQRRSFSGMGHAGNSSNNSSNNGNPVKRKLDYCWSFNKGAKCKFGKKCKFVERCSYCENPSHGVVNCHKLDKKEREGGTCSGGGGGGRRSGGNSKK